MTAIRVVSLVPSVTETLLCWGITPVGVTRFCEQPNLFAVGGTKDPNLEAILALAPDVVVLCDQENRREDATNLEAAGVPIHVIHLLHIDHNDAEMSRLAVALGVIGSIRSAAEPQQPRFAPPGERLIRAFVPIWKKPWMSINADTYASSLLARVGVQNIAAHLPDRYPTLTVEQVNELRPDLVLAPSEPYPFKERHRTQLEQFAPTEFVDGRDLFWWGARANDAQRRLETQLDAIRAKIAGA